MTAAVAGAGYLAYTWLREKIREASEASSAERSDQEKCHPLPTPNPVCPVTGANAGFG